MPINEFKIISDMVFIVKPHAHKPLNKMGLLREKKNRNVLEIARALLLGAPCLTDIGVMLLPQLYTYSIICHQMS